MTNHKDKNFIFGVLDRFEDKMGVVLLDDGQKVLWPEDKLPKETKEGDVVKLKIFSSGLETEEREKMVKAILSEILKVEEEEK